jgi:hypothetical protein
MSWLIVFMAAAGVLVGLFVILVILLLWTNRH